MTPVGAEALPPAEAAAAPPLLELTRIERRFAVRSTWLDRLRRQRPAVVHAVSDVSLAIAPGEVLGLVGESGCGKSTLARIATGLLAPSSGSVRYRGDDIRALAGESRRRWRRAVQMVFQDPYASLNPRMRVGRIVGEATLFHGLVAQEGLPARTRELLEAVGLPADAAERYPHQFSGGQRQRIAIARALAVEPALIVCDEPVAALDVSVQAQVLNLLLSLRDRFGLAYLFISHDLGVVQFLCDRIAVMYLGRIVEAGPADAVLADPRHPYTQALIAAMPNAGQRGNIAPPVRGEIPSPLAPPAGCAFHPRCPRALPRCRDGVPLLRPLASGRLVACIRADEAP
jgi:peptide/nickel transport system ATP-binding protein